MLTASPFLAHNVRNARSTSFQSSHHPRHKTSNAAHKERDNRNDKKRKIHIDATNEVTLFGRAKLVAMLVPFLRSRSSFNWASSAQRPMTDCHSITHPSTKKREN